MNFSHVISSDSAGFTYELISSSLESYTWIFKFYSSSFKFYWSIVCFKAVS